MILRPTKTTLFKYPTIFRSLLNILGEIFRKNGDATGALMWYQRALGGKEKALRKDHLSTLSTVNNMASTFQLQGDYPKALVWYQRALDGYQNTVGKHHPSTL